MSGPGAKDPLPEDVSDAVAHLAGSLQRLGLTLASTDPGRGIEHLPPRVLHRIATLLDTVPGPRARPRNAPPGRDRA